MDDALPDAQKQPMEKSSRTTLHYIVQNDSVHDVVPPPPPHVSIETY